MAEGRQASSRARARGNLNLREVPPGATIRLVDGATAEVLDNPKDGMWLICRYLSSPSDPAREGAQEPVFAHDVLEVLAEP